VVARIVDQRRPGVGDQGNVLPLFKLRDQRLCLLLLVMVVKGKQAGANGEMLQQQAGVPGILCGN